MLSKKEKKQIKEISKAYKNVLEVSPIIGFQNKDEVIKLDNNMLLGIYEVLTEDVVFLGDDDRLELYDNFYQGLLNYDSNVKFVGVDKEIKLEKNIKKLELLIEKSENEVEKKLLRDRLFMLEKIEETEVEKIFYAFAYYTKTSTYQQIGRFERYYRDILKRKIGVEEASQILKKILNKTEMEGSRYV